MKEARLYMGTNYRCRLSLSDVTWFDVAIERLKQRRENIDLMPRQETHSR